MILFVVDQVAGAEYIFPLLHKWRETAYSEWKVVCSPISASFLTRHLIDCTVLANPTIEEVKKIVDQSSPAKAVLSSSGGSLLEEIFLLELKKRRIPSFMFIDCWVNYSKRYERKNSQGEVFKFYPDKILTIDQKAKDEMIVDDIPEELIKVIGQPYFEYCLSAVNDRVLVKDGESLLLLTQPLSRYYEQRLGYDEKIFVKVCLNVWKELNKDWAKLSIVVHPAEDCEWYLKIISQYSPSIKILRGDYCDLKAYSLVVGMFSSMMIQSLLAGVNTVSLQPGARGEDMSFLSRHGYIRRFTTSEDFYNFLKDYADCAGGDLNMVNKLKSSLKGSCERFEGFLLNHCMED